MVHGNANPEQGIHLLLSLHTYFMLLYSMQLSLPEHVQRKISCLLRAEAGEAEGDF